MLTLILGTDWVENRAQILKDIAGDVSEKKSRRILMVPELISHEMERRLCAVAGNTACRYAEVLSFTRLARRVAETVGHCTQECLDNGGRVVAMAAAVRQLHSKLKAYAAVETRPEFLTSLVDAVDEFKRCCITAEDLKYASEQTSGSLAQKLEELALLLECYDALCERGKRDPRDQMTWLLGELEDSDYAAQHVFYIDGFPDFTRQHMAIIQHLIRRSDSVTVSLTCDKPSSTALAFEKAGQTAADLIRCARQLGVEVNIQYTPAPMNSLSKIRDKIFQGQIDETKNDDVLELFRSDSVYQEVLFVAEKINKLVRNGARYRQIGVACADSATYQNVVEMVFSRCHIPTYLSGTDAVLDKSVITAVLNALDTALGGFEQRDVIQYLKSILSPLNREMSDQMENYAVIWGINGAGWLKEWVNHPKGLGAVWTEHSQNKLANLNAARKQVIEPLKRLRDCFQSASTLGQMVEDLYTFFEEIKLSKRLMDLADRMDSAGDNRSAQILNQLWDILIGALEQLHDVLGQSAWDPEVFSRLFKLLLSQYDVGTIPTVLDAVTVGSVSAMQCQKVDYLFVLGALDGNLPGYSGSTGVLTDQERVILREIGVPLTGGSIDGLNAEFAEIYGVFCGAQKHITVTCPSGQPSFVYRRLCELAGGDSHGVSAFGFACCDPFEAGVWFVANGTDKMAAKAGVADNYAKITAHRDHSLGFISRENINALYGDKLTMSASQVDRQAQCRFSYFLRYGLHAEERKPATVDPAEFGTYVHAVLENTAKKIMEQGGFQTVSLEEALSIAADYSEQYAQQRFGDLDTQRAAYIFQRNGHELNMIVQELWKEMRASEFAPIGFEVGFGDDLELPSIQIPGRTMDAQLRGFVDRVDSWNHGESHFFRVVDYKTGKKDFDYCDIFNGLGLQMLLYLFALQQEGNGLIGDHPLPAGVQYFPARVPIVSADGLLSDEEASAAREKIWKRRGLLLNNDIVLGAMSSDETENRMPYTRKKDGTILGDLASAGQLETLKRYVFSLLGNMVDEIASGCIDPNPYTRGNSHNACAFCPYGSICHKDHVANRRNYKTMTSQKFWEEVEKEGEKIG